jgi:hypothetical protein
VRVGSGENTGLDGASVAASGYHIVEQLTVPCTPGRLSEDMVFDLGSFLVVVDGVTAKDANLFDGLSGGRFAAETVGAAFAALPDDITARAAMGEVSAFLSDATLRATGGVEVPRLPGVQLAAYSCARREVWLVGDVRARIGARVLEHLAPPTDRIAGEFRAALLHTLLLAGHTVAELRRDDPSRAAILPLLERQDALSNLAEPHPLGYGIVNGTPIPDRLLRVETVPAGETVVFATDGYLSVPATLAEAEAELTDVTARDPLMFSERKELRPVVEGGSFDDRAWVRFCTV